jgi:pimeloyl-ACP methyl ester carboxylesterase
MLERGPNTGTNAPNDLFPAIEPHRHGWLAVGDGHELYWEESGNPNGIPVIFLHGGPGAGTAPVHRRFFDPQAYRIMLFDQRGAGRSRPYAAMAANTTNHLVADVEAMRRHFGVDKWLVFGGSWGATLAVAYALRHGAHCLGLVLRGVFLGRQSELDWFLHGIRNVYPEAWARFVGFLPEAERADVLGAYHRRLMSDDKDLHGPAARAWNAYRLALAGAGQDRGALFRQRHVPWPGPARRRGRAQGHPRCHRPGPLRHGLSGRHRARTAPDLAGIAPGHGRRRRPFRHGAGNPPRAGRRDRGFQAGRRLRRRRRFALIMAARTP